MTNAAFDLDNRDMSLSRFAEALPTAYHYLAASCFCIYNRSEVVPSVWTHAHARLKDSSSKTEAARHVGASAELHLARQFREALLRAGIFGGMSRAINALQELHKVLPEDLRDKALEQDDDATTVAELHGRGSQFLTDVYGSASSKNIESALWTLSPRLGLYAVPMVYGGIYADTSALSMKEGCVLMFLCNTAVDTPKQAKGHIGSSKRHGATKEELWQAAYMANSIAQLEGVRLKHWEEIMEAVDSDAASETTPYDLR